MTDTLRNIQITQRCLPFLKFGPENILKSPKGNPSCHEVISSKRTKWNLKFMSVSVSVQVRRAESWNVFTSPATWDSPGPSWGPWSSTWPTYTVTRWSGGSCWLVWPGEGSQWEARDWSILMMTWLQIPDRELRPGSEDQEDRGHDWHLPGAQRQSWWVWDGKQIQCQRGGSQQSLPWLERPGTIQVRKT